MAEGLDVGDDLAVVEHRHRAAEIRQMADAAFGEIGVVHQEHVAGPHGLRRKIAHHGVRHRRIGAPGQLAAIAVEQADAVIMGFADHRAARGALDGVFDLGLDRIERAFDDLQHDRVDRRIVARARRRPRLCGGGFDARSSRRSLRRRRRTHDQDAVRIDLDILARKHHRRRAELLDHGGAIEPMARRQRGAIIDRRVAERAVEIDRAVDFRRGRRRRGARELRQAAAARSARSRRRRN